MELYDEMNPDPQHYKVGWGASFLGPNFSTIFLLF